MLDHSRTPARVLALAAALAAVVAGAPPAFAAWRSEIVTSAKDFARSSLRVRNGNPAVAYGDDAVYYGERVGAAWLLEVVDPGCAREASLAIDAAGEPAIAYTKDGAVHLARRDGAGWRSERVDAGSGPSLAFDPAGNPAIAYLRGGIRYAAWNGAGWDRESVDPFGNAGPDLAFDPVGNAAVSYLYLSYFLTDPHEVRLARRRPSWAVEVLVNDFESWHDQFGDRTALAFDDSGNPAVAWERVNDICEMFLTVSRWVGSAWIRKLAVSGNCQPEWRFLGLSLAADPAGQLAVAYVDPADRGIHLARRGATGWVRESVGVPGDLPALAFDAAGRPRVSAFDAGRGALTVSSFDGAGWSSEDVDVSLGDGGSSPSLAIHSLTGPAVSYVTSRRSLELARFDGQFWQRQEVDAAVSRDGSTLIPDAAGRPGIAYHAADQIRFAEWDGARFNISVAVPSIRTGDLSAARDLAGLPAIGFHAAFPAQDLRLARFDGAVWSIEPVDGATVVGEDSAVAFDRAGNPALSYRDSTNRDLRFARWDGTAWRVEVVDATGDTGQHTALAFDRAGDPAIAYYDATRLAARIARWDGTAWSLETVGRGYTVGRMSLAFDGGGEPAITWGFGRVARHGPQGWTTEVFAETRGEQSLAFDDNGRPFIAYAGCGGEVRIATDSGSATLYRGVVDRVDPGWRELSLPLTAANDDETQPFPLTTALPGTAADPVPPAGAELVLYRLLWDDGTEARNTLQLAARPGGGVSLGY